MQISIISKLAGRDVSSSAGIGFLFGLGSQESFHVVIVFSTSRLKDALEFIDIEILTGYACSSVVKRSISIWAILVVSRCFVFLEYYCSVFENFGEVFGYPFGVLKNGQ